MQLYQLFSVFLTNHHASSDKYNNVLFRLGKI